MLTYMLDTNICIYVMKSYPSELREKFNALAEHWVNCTMAPRSRTAASRT